MYLKPAIQHYQRMNKLIIWAFLLISFGLQGQVSIDSLLEALPVAQDTHRLQAINEIVIKTRATDRALTQRLMDEEYKLAQLIDLDRFTAEVHNSNGIFKYFQNELDSAIYYFDKSLRIYESLGNIRRAASLNNNIGILYEQKGDFDRAIQYHLASLQAKEESGDEKGGATSKFNMANVWVELGDYEKAKKLYLQSNEVFIQLGLENDINDVIFNLASVAVNQDSSLLALKYYKIALAHYDKIGDEYGVLDCKNNIGQAFYKLIQLDSAVSYYNEAMVLATQFENQAQVASLSRHIADVYSKQGKHREAITLLNSSVDIFNLLGYKDQLTDSYQYLYQAQENAGEYKGAYYNFENYVILRDSIASIQMQTDIVELETKYESEKKEKELVISRAENDRKQSRIRLLGTGLVSLIILFSALHYAIRQKVERTKVEKEKVATELREAEQQLEHKKKELTAKALQLAKKNEFLQELEGEVTELQSSIDQTVSKASSRISRMIQRDSNDHQEWEQFSREFSSVHQDFLDRLKANYGDFSKGEMRLIALLRMSLSSKDIANTLRISNEGIKKARYRLRKKMGLDKQDDLQGIIVGM